MPGAAKDGSDLAQDVAEDALGAAKNGEVSIVKVLILSIAKARAQPLRRYTTGAKPTPGHLTKAGNLKPQDAQGWSRARRRAC